MSHPAFAKQPANADPHEEAVEDGYCNLRLYVAGESPKWERVLVGLDLRPESAP